MAKRMSSYSRSLYKTPIYLTWANMKTRCYNSKVRSFADYGARGIRVCDDWQEFASFYRDMSATYFPGATIERIDNTGNYEKRNCRWATPTEQANNRRSNRLISIEGRTQTLAQWIRERGLKRSTVTQRYYVYGWPIERALELTT